MSTNPPITSTPTAQKLADQPALLANLLYSNLITNTNLLAQDAVAFQQSMNELGISVVAAATNLLTNTSTVGPDPQQITSPQQRLTGNSLDELATELKAAIANLQKSNPPQPT